MTDKKKQKKPERIIVGEGQTIVLNDEINSPVYGRKAKGFELVVGSTVRIVDAQAFVDRGKARVLDPAISGKDATS